MQKKFVSLVNGVARPLKSGLFYITRDSALIQVLKDAPAKVFPSGQWAEFETPKAKKANYPSWMRPLKITSPELAEIIGAKEAVRTEVVKKLWKFIKDNGLQDLKNRRTINVGQHPLTKAVFFGKQQVSMFEMTKIISKHMK